VLPKSITPQRIEDNLKVIRIEDEDMETLEGMAAAGKQQRVNTPLWGHDLVSCICTRTRYCIFRIGVGVWDREEVW